MHEQIERAEQTDDRPTILVSQHFYEEGQRYQTLDGRTVDRFVSAEFLPHRVYVCELVVTNPSSVHQALDILVQLPAGAIPVAKSRMTDTVKTALPPYHTHRIEYRFYFPTTGDFAHYPTQVTRDNVLVAAAEPMTFHVVETLSEIDRASWAYLSQNGTDQQVLGFLSNENLLNIDLRKIAFRMQDSQFFEQATKILRNRHMYNQVLWSYAIRHNKPQEIREFLDHQGPFLNACGSVLDSPLVTIDPVERRTYQHLEYHPLVNARAHRVGAERTIMNARFLSQYQHWLRLLSYRRDLSDNDRLVNVYYLLLQDRIADAIEQMQSINRSDLEATIQYDYCHAYLSMSEGNSELALDVASRYRDYPVTRWRSAFRAVAEHINGASDDNMPDSRGRRLEQLADTEPTFDFESDHGEIRLSTRNLDAVEVRYYLMDIELLFSRKPFVDRHQGQFSYIEPNRVEVVELSNDSADLIHQIPSELRNQNVLIEIEGGGRRKSEAVFSNSLDVHLSTAAGQLRVGSSGDRTALPRVYCKVYARMKDGSVAFYKDGYTDLRGRFDYATLSTDTLGSVERFAILIMSDDHGAVVRECDPPH